MASFSGRFLVLLVLLVCLMQVYECIKLPKAFQSKTEEEKEEEKRWKAAKIAYKRLFVWSDKLTIDDITEGIKALQHYKDQFDYDLDIDELMNIQEPKEELCDSREHMYKLRNLVKTTKSRYKALYECVNGAFEKQLALCNYGERFLNKFEIWKREHPDQWQLVQDFNRFAGRHGTRMYDWKGKHLDNTAQMNAAMTEMFEEQVYRGVYPDQRAMTYASYMMAQNLRTACTGFSDALGTALLMNTFNRAIKQDPEKLEWLRYLNVCEQVQRIDFSEAVQKMFANTGYLPGQQAWESYMGFRELYV